MLVGAINGQVFKIVRKRGAKKAELTFTLGMHRHNTQDTTPYTLPYTTLHIALFYRTHTTQHNIWFHTTNTV